MPEDVNLREAVRAVILDETQRILLVRFEFPGDAHPRVVWAAPGGGLEHGEDDEVALKRELVEEVGLIDVSIGPLIWTRRHISPMATGHDGQRERFYLIRTTSFDPCPAYSQAQLREESVTGMRWWTRDELARTPATLAPRHLSDLLESLIVEGPPPQPIDVGI